MITKSRIGKTYFLRCKRPYRKPMLLKRNARSETLGNGLCMWTFFKIRKTMGRIQRRIFPKRFDDPERAPKNTIRSDEKRKSLKSAKNGIRKFISIRTNLKPRRGSRSFSIDVNPERTDEQRGLKV
ncbi:hypothetical protein CH370_11040 [Leptospira kmetyi]|nr:hypothetical protein CH370_11040 [Leptospira kmetyi]